MKSFFLTLLLLLGLTGFDAQQQAIAQAAKKHVVILISEDPLNYEADKTMPPFADSLRTKYGFRVSVVQGSGKHHNYKFPQLELLDNADLLIVFCRRVSLPHAQMEQIRSYVKKGKPVVGIRTANHAFSNWDEPANGHEGWWGFVPDVLGCENKGYEPEELGVDVAPHPDNQQHPIVKNIRIKNWHSNGSLYKVGPLADKRAVVVLNGSTKNITEPVAWTRSTYYKGRVFYTSLGYPQDFEQAPFRQLLENGVLWALQLPIK